MSNKVEVLKPGTEVFVITKARPRQVLRSTITQATVRPDSSSYILFGHDYAVDSGAIHLSADAAFAVE
jgi:hypothetical protein